MSLRRHGLCARSISPHRCIAINLKYGPSIQHDPIKLPASNESKASPKTSYISTMAQSKSTGQPKPSPLVSCDSPPLPQTPLPVSPHSRKHAPAIRTSSRQVHHLAAQAAKLEIRSNIRQDWSWPPSPSQSSAPLRITPSTQWRPRDSDTSALPSPQHSQSSISPLDPYKYDNPDSLGQPHVARQQKRHRITQEESLWNEGLATYLERRDAWVGARSTPRQTSDATLANNGSCIPATQATLISPSSPSSSSSLSRSPSPMPSLLPLPTPLLPPENPIRASITPAAYSSIYSKVVTQGLTPTVPVNLSDMVKVLVQGWKENGEWPPKGEVQLEAKAKTTATATGGIRKSSTGEGKRKAPASEIRAVREKKGTGLAIRGVGRMKRALGLRDE